MTDGIVVRLLATTHAGGEEEEEEEGEEWSVDHVTKRHRRYLFLVVGPRPYETNPIETMLAADLKTFGRALKDRGAVIRMAPERADVELAKVAALAWPNDVGSRMRTSPDPFILVLESDFTAFDPTSQEWAIVWLSEYDSDTLYRVFTDLARITLDDAQDLFVHLRAAALGAKGKGVTRRLLAAIEIKPKLLGSALT